MFDLAQMLAEGGIKVVGHVSYFESHVSSQLASWRELLGMLHDNPMSKGRCPDVVCWGLAVIHGSMLAPDQHLAWSRAVLHMVFG